MKDIENSSGELLRMENWKKILTSIKMLFICKDHRDFIIHNIIDKVLLNSNDGVVHGGYFDY